MEWASSVLVGGETDEKLATSTVDGACRGVVAGRLVEVAAARSRTFTSRDPDVDGLSTPAGLAGVMGPIPKVGEPDPWIS